MMDKIYNQILFSTDLGPQSLYIGQRALSLSKTCHATLNLLHVIEPPITYTTNFSDREKKLITANEDAQKSLSALSQQLHVEKAQQNILLGTPQLEILEFAYSHHIDLIIVGSHGIGGYTHSLGSTAHYLLSEAFCDVLIIQVSHLKDVIIDEPPRTGKYLWQDNPLTPPKTKPSGGENTPKFGGSNKGFGEEIRRGPRLTNRPGSSPYKGGTRTRTSEEDQNTNQDD